jgi:hypothetical protein
MSGDNKYNLPHQIEFIIDLGYNEPIHLDLFKPDNYMLQLFVEHLLQCIDKIFFFKILGYNFIIGINQKNLRNELYSI